jgi:hypothetical protein
VQSPDHSDETVEPIERSFLVNRLEWPKCRIRRAPVAVGPNAIGRNLSDFLCYQARTGCLLSDGAMPGLLYEVSSVRLNDACRALANQQSSCLNAGRHVLQIQLTSHQKTITTSCLPARVSANLAAGFALETLCRSGPNPDHTHTREPRHIGNRRASSN